MLKLHQRIIPVNLSFSLFTTSIDCTGASHSPIAMIVTPF